MKTACVNIHECGCTRVYLCCVVQGCLMFYNFGERGSVCRCPSFLCVSSANRVSIEQGQMFPSLVAMFLVLFSLFSLPSAILELVAGSEKLWKSTQAPSAE